MLQSPLSALDALAGPVRAAARTAAPARRAVVVLSHAGRGGLAWFTLAPIVGSGARGGGRLGGSACSAAAVGSALAVSTGLARALDRRRPCDDDERPLIPCPDGGSLPSDQVAAGVAAAEVIGWFEPRLRAPILAASAGIGFARVAAGVHYPTDVLAGVALGLAIGRTVRAAAARAVVPRRR